MTTLEFLASDLARKAVSVAIDSFSGKLHSEQITAVLADLAAIVPPAPDDVSVAIETPEIGTYGAQSGGNRPSVGGHRADGLAAERERCAAVAETFGCGSCGMDGKAAAAIRALPPAAPITPS